MQLLKSLSAMARRAVAHVKYSPVGLKLRRFGKIAFSDKYLLYTNVTISMSLSLTGDVLEQQYEIYTNEMESWDRRRTATMTFSGMGVGFVCHHWYVILDKVLHGRTIWTVLKKLLLDQLICSPIMITIFFAFTALLEEAPLQDFTEEMTDKFWTLYFAEWVIWPPAQIINFYFLPTRFRVLYDNTISLGYDIYTSKVKHDKTLKNTDKTGENSILEKEDVKKGESSVLEKEDVKKGESSILEKEDVKDSTSKEKVKKEKKTGSS